MVLSLAAARYGGPPSSSSSCPQEDSARETMEAASSSSSAQQCHASRAPPPTPTLRKVTFVAKARSLGYARAAVGEFLASAWEVITSTGDARLAAFLPARLTSRRRRKRRLTSEGRQTFPRKRVSICKIPIACLLPSLLRAECRHSRLTSASQSATMMQVASCSADVTDCPSKCN